MYQLQRFIISHYYLGRAVICERRSSQNVMTFGDQRVCLQERIKSVTNWKQQRLDLKLIVCFCCFFHVWFSLCVIKFFQFCVFQKLNVSKIVRVPSVLHNLDFFIPKQNSNSVSCKFILCIIVLHCIVLYCNTCECLLGATSQYRYP